MGRSNHSQVIIIGGGPAGSAAAILLAQAGIKVLLFDKDKHPRYHVGESGILSLPFLLQLLGVEDRLVNLGVKRKGGVFFDWNERWLINWGATGDYTYHVERSEFDHLLLKRAQECGAQVFEEHKVKEILFEGERPVGVKVENSKKEKDYFCDYLIDASGRSALLARQYFKCQKPLKAFQNTALWGYWLKANAPSTLAGFEDVDGYSDEIENPITISAIPNGWIWGIPLHNKTLSVGVVLSQKYYDSVKKEMSKSEIYSRAILESEAMKDLLEPACLVSPLRMTADWSYVTEKWAGPGYFIVGDAAVFIDPLLSTGMTSAMLSSVTCAACIKEIYNKKIAPEKIFQFYGTDYRRRFWRLSFVIGALYAAKGHPSDLFYKTHCLTSKDLEGAAYDDIKRSFSSVISGLEDLKEVTASELQKIAGDRLRSSFKEYINIVPKMPYLPRNDLELIFEPLGLEDAARFAEK
ncbi:MAG: Kynurenine 3-monooxygenase [Chlamydiae bacterium]|nr:Kynurenine 3-monooxygenase [Chlamydiota bacterium]